MNIKYNESDRNKWEKYYKNGMSIAEVSKETGASLSVIGKHIKTIGIIRPIGRRCTAIIGINIKTGIKTEFKSISEAGDILNISNSNISGCLRGLRKTTAGFVWKYAEEDKVDNYE